ncbi:MAG: metallophosphatase family protein [Gammaproteobacteria bacterium]|nr:metallophosphatase family protein [Gammaproteobacteria bacterium]
MTTRIGIISDTHSSTAPLAEALEIFKTENVDSIICAGDVAGYGEDELIQTIRLLQHSDCLIVSGNHDVLTEPEIKHADEIKHFFDSLPDFIELTIEGKRIYIVHASPPRQQHGGIKLLDKYGNLIHEQLQIWQQKLRDNAHDVLIVGHTHQVFAEYIGNTLVINPGSTLYNHSCMVLSLPDMTISRYALEHKAIIKSWNWGLLFNDVNG